MRKMHINPITVWFIDKDTRSIVRSSEVVAGDDDGYLYDKDDNKVVHFLEAFREEIDAIDFWNLVLTRREGV